MSALRPLSIGVTDEERADLARLARLTGQSQTTIVRTALSRFMRGAGNGHSRWVKAKIKEEVAQSRGKSKAQTGSIAAPSVVLSGVTTSGAISRPAESAMPSVHTNAYHLSPVSGSPTRIRPGLPIDASIYEVGND